MPEPSLPDSLCLSHIATEGDGQNRRPVGQPAGSVQEQQQEAGSCEVLQFPGPEEAAGGGARPGGAVQRHHSYARTSLPHHLENTTKRLHSVLPATQHCLSVDLTKVLFIYFIIKQW